MAKRLRDIVILLPGITGSVLQYKGRDIWANSGQAAWPALRTLGGSLHRLELLNDDPDEDELADGIRATELVRDSHLVPGLIKIFDGYSVLPQLIRQNFIIERGSVHNDRAANYLEFPYDWRRDNRVAARKLKKLIDRRLRVWREKASDDARVILIAHSMGGLIARYYLEVLDGWRDCRALITFGTPYRGSLNALDFLVNGYKKLFIDLTEIMRSFTSMYQLLPIYKMLLVENTYMRIADVNIPGLSQEKAASALSFHREIETAVDEHRNDPEYIAKGYRLIPIVGVHQPTAQAAYLSQGSLNVHRIVPSGFDAILNDGDGTVPRLSAIPIELSNDYRDTFVPERHGALQANRSVLADVLRRIEQMQVVGLENIRGPEVVPYGSAAPALALDLDDMYIPDTPIEFRVKVLNAAPAIGPPHAKIRLAHQGDELIDQEFTQGSDHWVLRLQLGPGLYRIEVRTKMSGPWTPPPVHDLFEVAG